MANLKGLLHRMGITGRTVLVLSDTISDIGCVEFITYDARRFESEPYLAEKRYHGRCVYNILDLVTGMRSRIKVTCREGLSLITSDQELMKPFKKNDTARVYYSRIELVITKCDIWSFRPEQEIERRCVVYRLEGLEKLNDEP